MKNLSILILSALLVSTFSTTRVQMCLAQTEGFDVKTPVEKISDSATKLLKNVLSESANRPGDSIPRELICKAQCYLVIPSIDVDAVRGDFAGTGLLGCRTAASGKFTPPLFYSIKNLESFDEGGGGLIMLVTDREGVKAVLGDQLRLDSGNTGTGKTGSAADIKPLHSFVSYTWQAAEGIKGFDAAGSTLVYQSAYTFNAYQQTVDPIDIMVVGIDVPPALRGFNTVLKEWAKGCD